MNIKKFKNLLNDQLHFVVPSVKSRFADIESYLVIDEQPSKPKTIFKPLLISFASLFVAALLFTGGYLSFAPAINVTLDINPSFSLTLNAFNQVIDIEGESPEANTIISNMSRTRGAVDKIVAMIYEEGDFSGAEAYLLFGLDGKNYQQEQKLKEKLEDIKLASTTTVFVLNKHSEPSETFSFHFAMLASRESSSVQIETTYSQVTTAMWTQGSSVATTSIYNDNLNVIGVIDQIPSSSPGGALSESQYLELASTLNVSEAKLQIILEIFFHYDEYDSASDLYALADLDLENLFSLYEPIVSP